MDERGSVGEVLSQLKGLVVEDDATEAELQAKSRIAVSRRRGFKKRPDTPLGVVLAAKKAKTVRSYSKSQSPSFSVPPPCLSCTSRTAELCYRNFGVMRLDRKLGATPTAGGRLHPTASFAPHVTVASFAGRLRPHHSQSQHSVRRSCERAILVGSAAIRNPHIPLKQHAMFFSNRSRIAGLRARLSHVLHATNHQLRRSTHLFLSASRQLLEIRLNYSQQTRKHFLIAGFFAFSSHRAFCRDRETEILLPVPSIKNLRNFQKTNNGTHSNPCYRHGPRYATSLAALTTLHPSPTMKSVPCTLQRVAICIFVGADHGSLIKNHKSQFTGYQNV
jgi:hypothetical protein